MLPREQARAVLLGLRRDALEAKRLIEEDMRARYGFVWDVLIGFHAVPSVEYVLIPLRHLMCVLSPPLSSCGRVRAIGRGG